MSKPSAAVARLLLYNTSKANVPYTMVGPRRYGYVEALPMATSDVAMVANWIGGEALTLATKGIRWLPYPIRVRSTANVNLANGLENGDTLNGVTLATGDFVFLGSQTDPKQNGIYTVVASGAASRSTFADSADELGLCAFTIREGTAGKGEQWTLPLEAADITVGSTDLNFSLIGLSTAATSAASRTALKALSTSAVQVAYLGEGRRAGLFGWQTGDFSALVGADTEEAVFIAADDTAATSGAWVRDFGGMLPLEWFGAANDGSTADDDALDAAYELVMAMGGGALAFLPGDGYRLNAEHSIWPEHRLQLHFYNGAKILCGLSGADKVMLDATNPGDPTDRGMELVFSGTSRIKPHSSITDGTVIAVYLQHRYASDLKFEGASHEWESYRDNTMLRISGAWNCDLDGLSLWGGGARKSRKTTGTTTFSIDTGTTTVTASGSVFAAGDVGDVLVLKDEMFTIASYTDATHVEVSKAATQTLSGERGSFGSVQCTTVASDGTITLTANALTSADVGRVALILDGAAGYGSGSPKIVHRGVVTSQSGNAFEMSPAPSITNASPVEIVFSPAVEIFNDTEPFDGETNDINLMNLDVADFRGTGVAITGGTSIIMPFIKSHAVNGEYNDDASDYCAVISGAQVRMDGFLEGTTTGRLGRIVLAGLFNGAYLPILSGIGIRNQALLHMHNCADGAYVLNDCWMLNNEVDAGLPGYAFTKTGGGHLQGGRLSGTNIVFNYPSVMGTARPKVGLIPSSTDMVVAKDDGVSFGVITSDGIPTIFGARVAGTVDAPTGVADFATAARFLARAKAPTGDELLDIGGLYFLGRDPSGANVRGLARLLLRNLAGTLATIWEFDSEGAMFPSSDGLQDIGWTGGRLRTVYANTITRSAPVIKTANFTVADAESYIINNKTGSACVATLPAAASFIGREIIIKTIQAQAVNSATSNVVPLNSATAAAAIVTGTAGKWAKLVSDGTNWVVMEGN